MVLRHFCKNALSAIPEMSPVVYQEVWADRMKSVSIHRKRKEVGLEQCVSDIDRWYNRWRVTFHSLLAVQRRSSLPIDVMQVRRFWRSARSV